MSEYMGRYERRARRFIKERESIEINWINMSEREALSGGADRITNMLREAGYRPDASGVVAELKEAYVNGTEKIRLPQETWILIK